MANFSELYDAFLKTLGAGKDSGNKGKGCLVLVAIALAALVVFGLFFESLPEYPNPATVSLSFNIVEGQHSSAKIRVVGAVQNLGPVPTKPVGMVALYRFDKKETENPIGKINPLKTTNIVFEVNESCFGSDAGTYYLKIEYSTAQIPQNVDSNLNDNEIELKGKDICIKIIESYLSNYRNALLALINTYRASHQLPLLAIDQCLNSAAQKHSEWMQQTGVFSHTGENGSNQVARCKQAGCACSSETIYQGSNAPIGAFNSWKQSPPHNAIMLGSHNKIGIGLKLGNVTAVYE